jgi:protein SCO1/2
MTPGRIFRAMLATLPLAAALLAAGCSGDGERFNLTNVTGKMPALKLGLTSAGGDTVTAGELRGKAVLLYFGYTHCPDVCPMSLGAIKTALAKLPDEKARRTAVVFVTADPERDTPKRLRDYLANFHLPNAVGLIGEGEAFQRLKERYHVYTKLQKDGPDDTDYEVSHPSQVYVFGPDGRARLLARLSGNPGDSPADLAADLEQLLR